MLRIRTLGGLSVQCAGKAPTGAATQPRRLAVLALVARAGERGITREKLLALLWPDTDEEAGRRALSQSLYALRRDLGAEELTLGVQELRLNPDVVTCDVLEFEVALAEKNHERAADLYAGPFLDGFRVPGAGEFDRWVDEERRSLEQRHLDLLERLARRSLERGDPAGGARWWRRIADLDPLNARYAVELMRSLVAAGDPGGALKHARIYEALLAQELDVEPDRQVIELAKRIRTEASAPAANAAACSAPPPMAVATSVAVAPEPPAAAPFEPDLTPALPAPEPSQPPARQGIRIITAELPNEPTAAASPPTRWSRRHISLAVAALVLVVLSATAWWSGWGRGSATDVPVLAVGRIVDYRGGGSRDADAITDMLATNLARVPGLQVLSSARLYEVLAQTAASQTSVGVAKAAERAGATEMVEGGLHAVGGRLVLDLRRVDVTTGAVRGAYRVEGDDVYKLVTDATTDLARSLDHPVGPLDPADVSTRSLVAYRFYEEGLRGIGRGDYRSAVRMLEAATGEDSTFAMAAYYLVLARDMLGTPNPADAWPRLLALSERAPERERLMIRGTWALSTSLPELSALADSLAERYPAEVDGPYLQGYARMQNADFTAAIPYMKRVMALDSLGFEGQSARCRACDALGQLIYAYTSLDSLPAAERLARDYVRRQPRSARAWMALSGVLLAGEHYDDALSAYRTAMSISPVNVYDRVFPAIIQLRRGNFEETDRLARDVLRTGAPGDADEARWLLVLSLRYQRRWHEALALTREGIAAYPPAQRNNSAVHTLRSIAALILLESGQPREAAAVWDSLARTKPSDLEQAQQTARLFTFTYTLLTSAHASAGDTARARVAADSALAWSTRSLNRRDAHIGSHANGISLAARGDTAGAIAALERAVYSPTTGYMQTNRELARLYLATNRPADAARVLGAALRSPTMESGSLYVTRTELHELLARAYDRLGKPDSAAVHYERVVRALANADAETRPAYDAAVARLSALRPTR